MPFTLSLLSIPRFGWLAIRGYVIPPPIATFKCQLHDPMRFNNQTHALIYEHTYPYVSAVPCLCFDGKKWDLMCLLCSLSWLQAVFVGHNHGLDWCCPYKKLWLCFARHTGYGGYGNWARGARTLEITQQPFSLKSWIRMEDGHTHSEVILSS